MNRRVDELRERLNKTQINESIDGTVASFKAKMKGNLLPPFLPWSRFPLSVLCLSAHRLSLSLEQLFNISSNPTPTPFSLILIVDYMSLSRLCPSTIFSPLLSISKYTIISAHCMSIHSYLSYIWFKREREREQERLTERGWIKKLLLGGLWWCQTSTPHHHSNPASAPTYWERSKRKREGGNVCGGM